MLNNGFFYLILIIVKEVMSRKKVKYEKEKEKEETNQSKSSNIFESIHIEIADPEALKKLSTFAVIKL